MAGLFDLGSWGGVASAGLNWLAQNNTAQNTANNQNAANAAASAQATEAAKLAAQQSRFTPVGMTNAFGTSNFTLDKNGMVSSAGYELNPYLAATQQRLMQGIPGQVAGAEAQQGAAAQLYGLGNQYLATSPEQASQQWMQQQQALMKPQQDVQMAELQNRLAQTGRGGLSIAQGGNLGAANPELQAYYNAQAQQQAQMAQQADAYGRDRTNYGAGLFQTGTNLAAGAYAPLTSNLATNAGVNELGQSAFNTGVMLGGKNANPTGANALAQAGALQAGFTAKSPQYYTNWAAPAAGASSWFSNALGGK
jgi:hypothetical protein